MLQGAIARFDSRYPPRAARNGRPGSIMLSAIVFCENAQQSGKIDAAEFLVRSLSSLIRANVEGLLGDVAIAGPLGQGLGLVADQASCSLFEAASEREWLRRAIEAARGPELFLLRSGFATQTGFIEEAGDFLRARSASDPGSRNAALLRAEPETFIERLFPRTAPLAGLIAPRDRCVELSAKKSTSQFTALARSFRSAAALRTNARRIG